MTARSLLAVLAGFGALAAGCTNAPADQPGTATPVVVTTTKQTPTTGKAECYKHTEYNGCLQDWNFAIEGYKAVWVDVTGYVPFPPTPSGRACAVPVMEVHPGALPTGTQGFTLTTLYASDETPDGRQGGIVFTAADGAKYTAYYDYDDTLYRFTRGYALVFTPCPEWAQG